MVEGSIRVVHVDSFGHRVVPGEGDPWDKELANAVVLLVKASYMLSKVVGSPIGTVRVDWPGGFAVAKYDGKRVIGLVYEDKVEAPRSIGGARASVEA